MRKTRLTGLIALMVIGAAMLLEACASGRAGSRSVWFRTGSCPATRVDNHVY
ncbi:MAG: hypothetical protein NZZ60_02400 [Bacteroidia bacterium]|nr:hypothetical protein [Bacteroidia bacterium]MCX7652231.1 hypothetical protein [Bacteroidia bacterium]MDW8416494.1 hypothetical protein [Bacteroidia bacterium]